MKYILAQEGAVEPLSSEKEKEVHTSKIQDSWTIKSNTPSNNLPKKKVDVLEKKDKSCLTMPSLHHLDSQRAKPKELQTSVDLRRDSGVITTELQNAPVSIKTKAKDPNTQIKKTIVRTKKLKKGHLKARQSKKSKEKRKNVDVSIDEEDSLHVTMDLGGTTIPAEPSKSEISAS